MKRTIFLVCLFSIILFRCDTSNELEYIETDISLVTGLYLVTESGTSMGVVGNPNEKGENIFVYPNPALHNINVDAPKKITRIWIVQGNAMEIYEDTNFTSLLDNHIYQISDVAARSIREIFVDDSVFSIEFLDLGPGYYRIFILLEDESLSWKNVCILEEGETLENFMTKW